jgi:hypothetical protein
LLGSSTHAAADVNEKRDVLDTRDTVTQPVPHASRHPTIIAEAVAGLGSPVGYGGASISTVPFEWLAFGPGVGWGSAGTQLAALSRLRLAIEPDVKLTFNLAYSNGPYRSFARQCAEGIECTSRLEVARAHWLHMGWGFEFLMDQGSVVRFDWGVAALLNPGDARCVEEARGVFAADCRAPGQNLALAPLLLVAPLLRLSPCAEDTCSDPLVFVALSGGHALW